MPREIIKKSSPTTKTRVTKARKVAKAKKKDPEAPYSNNPTPGKPGWNVARKKPSAKKRNATALKAKAKRSKKA
tara:strand:- start:363 stop:584 length:222 start_codon:yes stop_codon:yes gene_type:complete